MKKSSVLDGQGYSGKVLVYDASRSQSEVPHFRVSHLSPGKADGNTRSLKLGLGVIAGEFVNRGGVGMGDGVSFERGIFAPAVEDYEKNRFDH